MNENHSVRCVLRLAFALLAVGITDPIVANLVAQEAKSTRDAERTERLTEMQRLIQPMQAFEIVDGKRVPVEFKAEPLQRWNDPTREFSDGSLWLWTSRGRPVAAIAVELYPTRTKGQAWSFELVSLSTGLVELDGGTGFDVSNDDFNRLQDDMTLNWTPKTAGIEIKELPGAPVPGKTESARLRQMRVLAERFSADEFYEPTKQKYMLRLLPHPAHRYADAASDILDGAVFLIAHGTNPEVFLSLEARGKSPETARWCYALARLSMAALTVRLDKNVVWTLPLANKSKASDNYYIFRKSRKTTTGAPGDSGSQKVNP